MEICVREVVAGSRLRGSCLSFHPNIHSNFVKEDLYERN